MMIAPRILFFILLLDLVYSSKFTLDWTKCDGMDRVCFLTEDVQPQVLKGYMVNGPMEEKYSGMQIRPYSDTKWLVFLQSEGFDLDPKDGLKLWNGVDVMFGCFQPPNKPIEYVGHPPNGLTLKSYNDYSRFEGKTGLCAFTAEGPHLKSALRGNPAFKYTVKPALPKTFSANDVLHANWGIVEVKPKISCDPDSLKLDPSKAITGYDDYIKSEITDIARRRLDCRNEQLMMVIPKGPSPPLPLEVDTVECIAKTQNAKITYTYTYKTASEEQGELSEAFCADTCKPFAPAVKKMSILQYPARIICPFNKWLINGDYYIVGNPVCKRKGNNELGWFIKKKDGVEVEITSAECYEKIDCLKFSTLKPDCPQAPCAQVIYGTGKIACPPNHILRVVQPSGRSLHLPHLVCNGESGRWKGPKTPEEVEDGATAYCEQSCEAVSPLKDDCPQSKKCSNILRNDQQIQCPAAHSLRVESAQQMISPESLTCNIANGRWKTAENVEIAAGAKAYCEATSLAAAPSVLLSLAAPLAVSSIVIAAVLATIAGVFIYKRRKNTREAEEAVEVKKGGGLSTMAPETTVTLEEGDGGV